MNVKKYTNKETDTHTNALYKHNTNKRRDEPYKNKEISGCKKHLRQLTKTTKTNKNKTQKNRHVRWQDKQETGTITVKNIL